MFSSVKGENPLVLILRLLCWLSRWSVLVALLSAVVGWIAEDNGFPGFTTD